MSAQPSSRSRFPDEDAFITAVQALGLGYRKGWYDRRRWGVTLNASADGRRHWLYGEELGGTDRVSFNLYLVSWRPVLRPCEMPAEKVIAFVIGFNPE